MSPQELESGKYTGWATRWGISEEMLHALVRIVGEFDKSAPALLDLLWEYREEWTSARRAYLALTALHRLARGERLEVKDWARRMGSGRIGIEPSDLPDAAQRALQAAVPDAVWNSAMTIPEGYEVFGNDAAGEPWYAYLSSEGAVNHFGRQRQRRRRDPSAIPESLERLLETDPMTRWAVAREFSVEHLHCLVWLAGEAGGRIQPLLEILERHPSAITQHRRAVTALEVLCNMVRFGEWMHADELLARIERKRAKLAWQDLPLSIHAALQKAAPGVQWGFLEMVPDGYALSGKAADGKSFGADVRLSGSLTLSRGIAGTELPAPILADLARRAKIYRVESACAVGPDLSTVREYIVDVELEPYPGRTLRLRLDYSAEGRELADAANE